MRAIGTWIRSALVLALVAALPAVLKAQDFKVIVNAGNSVESLSGDDASKIFLKQSAKFPNGVAAAPVDQKGSVRTAFFKAVHGRAAAAIDTYWQQQVFSGKEVPPAAKASDDDVIAFVKGNPGGIGYVSGAASTAGVKVITVKP